MNLQLDEAVEITAMAITAAKEALDLIDEATESLPGPEQAATRMLILEMLLVYTCEHLGELAGARGGPHPRELATKLYEQALKMLPEKPLEERPIRAPRRRGPSPWGEVR